MKGNLLSNLKKYTGPFVTKKREIFFFYIFIIVIDYFLRLYYWYYLNGTIPYSAYFLNSFLVLLLVMASLVVIGVSATLQVEKMMYTDSELQPAESLPDPNLVEVPATISPKFVMADGRIVQNKDVQAIRKLITKRGRSMFLLTILRDLIAGAGYFYIPLLTANAFGLFTYEQYYGYLNLDWLIWFFAALRLLFHSRQFNPIKTSFDSIGSILLLPFRILSTPWLQPVIFAVIVFPALIRSVSILISSGDYYELIASLLPLIFHLSLIVFIRPSTEKNKNLVILRTFQINKNSPFIFERLTHYWKHIGNVYTVVDPSYLLFTYRFVSQRSLALTTLLLFTSKLVPMIPFFIFCILFVLIANIIQYFIINHNIIKNRADFLDRFRKFQKRGRTLNELTFRNLFTINYGNTWQSTVDELVNIADVVLMDLRGFSEDKSGCEYEINFLLENISLEKVVFLVSLEDKDNSQLIFETIYNKWKSQHSDSKNLEEDKIQIYLSADEKEIDVQGLLSQLTWVTTSNNLNDFLEVKLGSFTDALDKHKHRLK